MTPEERAAWGKASRAASGVPEKIEDPAVIARLVVLSDVENDGGGAGAMTPPPQSIRRHRRSQASAGADDR